MEKYAEQFLTNFAKITQSRSGRWEQRFYTDGTLAPSWGYQIDETAIMIIMAYEHYLHTKDKAFLKQVLPMLQNAFKYLEKYVDDILNNVDTKTFDLWENLEEDTIYGLTSVFYAIKVMKEIFEELKEEYSENRLQVEQMNRQIRTILPTLEKLKKHISFSFSVHDFKRARGDSAHIELIYRRMRLCLRDAVLRFQHSSASATGKTTTATTAAAVSSTAAAISASGESATTTAAAVESSAARGSAVSFTAARRRFIAAARRRTVCSVVIAACVGRRIGRSATVSTASGESFTVVIRAAVRASRSASVVIGDITAACAVIRAA